MRNSDLLEVLLEEHKNLQIIAFYFAVNSSMKQQLQAFGAKYSATKRAWWLEDTTEHRSTIEKWIKTQQKIQNVLPWTKEPKPTNKDKENNPIQTISSEGLSQNKAITLELLGHQILVKMPKNESDILFLRQFQYIRWNNENRTWIVPNFGKNWTTIVAYFNSRANAVVHQMATIGEASKDDSNTSPNRSNVVYFKALRNQRLRIICPKEQHILQAIKSCSFAQWHAANKYWTVPHTESFFERIKKACELAGFDLQVETVEEQPKIQPKPKASAIPNYRKCPTELVEKLKELRYSENTIKQYEASFEEFINYHFTEEIDAIDERQIIAFLRYLVNDRKVSQSYQNQSINAIKFYYERVKGGTRKTYFIERPRREKTLPEVFSVEEVAALIAAIENTKHKTIIMLIYSAGLRISELLNLRSEHIDSKRMQIRIEQSKGKRDRYTLLSVVMLEQLRSYFRQYKPKEYLFEGPAGGQYSARSAQAIMREALKKTGIKKTASLRTLRHSFATHLLEEGTDLRYIQSLMGHGSSKTTEIYTHVTTKGFSQLISPMDRLFGKK